MTSPEEVLRAVSLTRVHEWGMEVSLLGYLAGEPAPFGSVQHVSLRSLAAETGIEIKLVRRALARLEKRGVIARDAGRGREASAYFVRDPREWHGAPWRVDRARVALALNDLVTLRGRAKDVGSARLWRRARARTIGGNSQKPTSVVRDSQVPSRRGLVRDSGVAHYGGPSLSRSSRDVRLCRADVEGGREIGINLTEERRSLLLAFFDGAGRHRALYGRLLDDLLRLADDAGDFLPSLLELAADPAGPALFTERLAGMMTAHRDRRRFEGQSRVAELRMRKREIELDIEGCDQVLQDDPDNRQMLAERQRCADNLDEVLELLANEEPPSILEA